MLLVGAVVAAGTGADASAAELPTVTLTVDGSTSSVTTTASTVDELLTDENVTTDANDAVTPGLSSRVANGMKVDVVTRVAVRVKRQGRVEAHLVSADTAGQLVSELSLPTRSATAADVTAASSADAVVWSRTVVQSPRGRRLTADDRLFDGSIAHVQRVRVVTDSRRELVRARTVRKHTPLLHSGTTKVLQSGRNGSRYVTVRTTRINGTLVRRAILHKKVLRDTRRHVIAVGTGPNWPALARCESGNNPRAVNPSGFYGLYQFSVSTWQAVGGSGNPIDASRWEQTKRAWILYRRSGSSPWPVCGANL
jgi:resuscitation-promoting factor RpfB